MGEKQCLTEDAKWGYLLIAPATIGPIVLDVYPFLQTLVLSSSATYPFGYYEVSGTENYVQMFGSKESWRATWNSTYFCILTVLLGILLSLLTAVLLNVKIRAKAAFRAVYFLSMVVAPAAMTIVWRWIFNAEYGIINQVIGNRVNWLTNPKLMLPICAVVAVWSAVRYDVVLLLSGMQNMSKNYCGTASLGEVSKMEQFSKITFPMISPTLSVVLIVRLMAPSRVHDLIYMMVDQTNPALTSTQSLMYLFYRGSSVAGNHGYAFTIIVWTMLLIGAVTALQFWGQKKRVSYKVQDGGKL